MQLLRKSAMNDGHMRSVVFISHPNVVVSRELPVPQWPLSNIGKARLNATLAQPWIRGISAVYSSTEQKAIDGPRSWHDICHWASRSSTNWVKTTGLQPAFFRRASSKSWQTSSLPSRLNRCVGGKQSSQLSSE